MYRKPGFHEASAGRTFLDWGDLLYEAKDPSTSWEMNVRLFFESISKNMRRKLAYLQIEDVVTASTPISPFQSKAQVAFSHLMTRWMESLSIPGIEHPAVIEYSRTPFLTFDECIDELISKDIVFPDWTVIGDKQATLEIIYPVFLRFIRHLRSLQYLRRSYASRLRAMVSDICYRIASGQAIDQFEKSFVIAFSDATSGFGVSEYAPLTANQGLVENSDPNVIETFNKLKTAVEAGPFTRFGILVSNKLQQELFGFWGPFTPTLNFASGYSTRCGNFIRFEIDEDESIPWSIEEQEDAIRSQSNVLTPGVSSLLTVSSPFLSYTAQRDKLRNSPEATYSPKLDVPDVSLRMARGFQSLTNEIEKDWMSPTRGRVITSSHGATAEIFLQDLAAQHDKFGEGQVANTSLTAWKLVDPESLKALGDRYVPSVDYQERVLFMKTDGPDIHEKIVDMRPFYALRGEHMFRPAFIEYLAPHRNQLMVEDPAAEAFIARALDLTRNARRRSARVIRISHRWNLLRRLLNVDIMSFEDLVSYATRIEGSLSNTETTTE